MRRSVLRKVLLLFGLVIVERLVFGPNQLVFGPSRLVPSPSQLMSGLTVFFFVSDFRFELDSGFIF